LELEFSGLLHVFPNHAFFVQGNEVCYGALLGKLGKEAISKFFDKIIPRVDGIGTILGLIIIYFAIKA